MKTTFGLVSQRKADGPWCAIRVNRWTVLLSRRQDASYPFYLKKGKTGTLDKGGLQDRHSFSSALKGDIWRKAKMAELSDKGLASRDIRWLCEEWLPRRGSCFKMPQKFSVKWEVNSKGTFVYSSITYKAPPKVNSSWMEAALAERKTTQKYS